jgi:lia operon protein LiaG
VKIKVPMNYAEGIHVKMGSGNLAFDGKSMFLNRLGVEIKSGNTRISDIQVNRLSGDLYSGNLHMEQVVAVSQSIIKVRSGNLTITHFNGPLSIDSWSGNVGVQLDSLEKNVTVNTKSGNVKLNLPNDAGFRIKAQLNSGNIHNSLPLRDSMSGNNYLVGTHGDGKSLVKINGWSGNVKIY